MSERDDELSLPPLSPFDRPDFDDGAGRSPGGTLEPADRDAKVVAKELAKQAREGASFPQPTDFELKELDDALEREGALRDAGVDPARYNTAGGYDPAIRAMFARDIKPLGDFEAALRGSGIAMAGVEAGRYRRRAQIYDVARRALQANPDVRANVKGKATKTSRLIAEEAARKQRQAGGRVVIGSEEESKLFAQRQALEASLLRARREPTEAEQLQQLDAARRARANFDNEFIPVAPERMPRGVRALLGGAWIDAADRITQARIRKIDDRLGYGSGLAAGVAGAAAVAPNNAIEGVERSLEGFREAIAVDELAELVDVDFLADLDVGSFSAPTSREAREPYRRRAQELVELLRKEGVITDNRRSRLLLDISAYEDSRVDPFEGLSQEIRRLKPEQREKILGGLRQDIERRIAKTLYDYTSADQEAALASARMREPRLRPGSFGREILAPGLSAVLQMAPSLLASVLASNPAPALAFGGFMGAGSGAAQGDDAGLSARDLSQYSTEYGLAEAIPEALSVGALLRGIRGVARGQRSVAGAIAESTGAEAVQESVTELLQAGSDFRFINPNLTRQEVLERVWHAAQIGAVAGGVTNTAIVSGAAVYQGARGAVAASGRRTREKAVTAAVEEIEADVAAADAADRLDRMTDAAAELEIAVDSQDAARAALEMRLENDAEETGVDRRTIYLNAEEALSEEGFGQTKADRVKKLSEITGVSEERILQASETPSGRIEVKTAEYLVRAADHPESKYFSDIFTFDPSAPSVRDRRHASRVKGRLAKGLRDVEEAAGATVGQAPEPIEGESALYESVYRQLIRIDPQRKARAELQARAFTAIFRTWSLRTGVPLDALAERYLNSIVYRPYKDAVPIGGTIDGAPAPTYRPNPSAEPGPTTAPPETLEPGSTAVSPDVSDPSAPVAPSDPAAEPASADALARGWRKIRAVEAILEDTQAAVQELSADVDAFLNRLPGDFLVDFALNYAERSSDDTLQAQIDLGRKMGARDFTSAAIGYLSGRVSEGGRRDRADIEAAQERTIQEAFEASEVAAQISAARAEIDRAEAAGEITEGAALERRDALASQEAAEKARLRDDIDAEQRPEVEAAEARGRETAAAALLDELQNTYSAGRRARPEESQPVDSRVAKIQENYAAALSGLSRQSQRQSEGGSALTPLEGGSSITITDPTTGETVALEVVDFNADFLARQVAQLIEGDFALTEVGALDVSLLSARDTERAEQRRQEALSRLEEGAERLEEEARRFEGRAASNVAKLISSGKAQPIIIDVAEGGKVRAIGFTRELLDTYLAAGATTVPARQIVSVSKDPLVFQPGAVRDWVYRNLIEKGATHREATRQAKDAQEYADAQREAARGSEPNSFSQLRRADRAQDPSMERARFILDLGSDPLTGEQINVFNADGSIDQEQNHRMWSLTRHLVFQDGELYTTYDPSQYTLAPGVLERALQEVERSGSYIVTLGAIADLGSIYETDAQTYLRNLPVIFLPASRAPRARGSFSPAAGIVLYISEQSNADQILSTLIHELDHAFRADEGKQLFGPKQIARLIITRQMRQMQDIALRALSSPALDEFRAAIGRPDASPMDFAQFIADHRFRHVRLPRSEAEAVADMADAIPEGREADIESDLYGRGGVYFAFIEELSRSPLIMTPFALSPNDAVAVNAELTMRGGPMLEGYNTPLYLNAIHEEMARYAQAVAKNPAILQEMPPAMPAGGALIQLNDSGVNLGETAAQEAAALTTETQSAVAAYLETNQPDLALDAMRDWIELLNQRVVSAAFAAIAEVSPNLPNLKGAIERRLEAVRESVARGDVTASAKLLREISHGVKPLLHIPRGAFTIEPRFLRVARQLDGVLPEDVERVFERTQMLQRDLTQFDFVESAPRRPRQEFDAAEEGRSIAAARRDEFAARLSAIEAPGAEFNGVKAVARAGERGQASRAADYLTAEFVVSRRGAADAAIAALKAEFGEFNVIARDWSFNTARLHSRRVYVRMNGFWVDLRLTPKPLAGARPAIIEARRAGPQAMRAAYGEALKRLDPGLIDEMNEAIRGDVRQVDLSATPGFHLATLRALTDESAISRGAVPGSYTAQQWGGWIAKQDGVTQDELRAIDWPGFVEANKGRVISRAEVVDYISSNAPRIEIISSAPLSEQRTQFDYVPDKANLKIHLLDHREALNFSFGLALGKPARAPSDVEVEIQREDMGDGVTAWRSRASVQDPAFGNLNHDVYTRITPGRVEVSATPDFQQIIADVEVNNSGSIDGFRLRAESKALDLAYEYFTRENAASRTKFSHYLKLPDGAHSFQEIVARLGDDALQRRSPHMLDSEAYHLRTYRLDIDAKEYVVGAEIQSDLWQGRQDDAQEYSEPFRKTWHEAGVRTLARFAFEQGAAGFVLPSAAMVATGENIEHFYEGKVQGYGKRFAKTLGAKARRITEGALDGALLIEFTPEATDALTNETLPLFQGERADLRGQAVWNEGNLAEGLSKFDIVLTNLRDASTFMHEAAHVTIEMMLWASTREGAAQEIRDDVQAFLKFTGLNEDALATPKGRKEFHEKIASAFEEYLKEGKAPVPWLREAFARLMNMISEIYKQIVDVVNGTKAGKKVTSKVHGVYGEASLAENNVDIREYFDRWFALQSEIESAKQEMGFIEIFEKSSDVGFTSQEWQIYLKLSEAAQNRVFEGVIGKATDALKKERKLVYEDRLRAQRVKSREALRQTPPYAAFFRFIEGAKISAEALRQHFPDIDLNALPKWKGAKIFAEPVKARRSVNGEAQTVVRDPTQTQSGKPLFADVDAAAAAAGYTQRAGGAAQMIQDFLQLEPFEAAAERNAEAAVREFHPDYLDGSEVVDDVREVLHSDATADMLEYEIKVLGEKAGQRGITKPVAKLIAEDLIGEMTLGDIKPQTLLANERRFARLAQVEAAKLARVTNKKSRAAMRHFNALIRIRQQQLIAFEMFRQAREVEKRIIISRRKARRWLDQWRKLKNRDKAKSVTIAPDYLEQMEGLMHRYQFTKTTRKARERQASFAAWVAEMREEGRDAELVDIPDHMLSNVGTVNIEDLTVAEFRGLMDTLENLAYLGGLKQDLKRGQKIRERERKIDGMVEGLAKRAFWVDTEQPTDRTTPWRMVHDWIASFFLSGVDAGTIAREQIDAGKEMGVAYEALIGPAQRGVRDLPEAQLENSKALNEIDAKLTRRERDNADKKQIVAGMPLSLNQRLALALNMGSESNREAVFSSALFQGEAGRAKVEEILSTLEERHWDWVQAVWDHIGSYRDQIGAVEREITGVEPPWVEPKEVETQFGTLRGGYYPLRYADGNVRHGAPSDAITEGQFIEGGLVQQTARMHTAAGFARARKGSGGREVLLDIRTREAHLNAVLYHIHMGAAVAEIGAIIRNPRFRAEMERAGRHVGLRELDKYILALAEGEQAPRDFLERTARMAKSNLTFRALAYSIPSAAINISGITNTIGRLGLRRADVVVGVKEMAQNAVNGWADVYEESAVMRERRRVGNKEISDAQRAKSVNLLAQAVGLVSKRGKRAAEAMVEYGYVLMTISQMPVDLATYYAARRRGLDMFKDLPEAQRLAKAIEYAERIVEESQSAQSFVALSSIERGQTSTQSGQQWMVRTLSTLMSYMRTKPRILYRKTTQIGDAIRAGDLGRGALATADFVQTAVWIYAIEAAMVLMIRAALHGDWLGDDLEEEDSGWLEMMATETLKSVAGSFVLTAGISSESQGFRGGGGMGALMKDAGRLVSQTGQGEVDEAFIKSLISAGSIIVPFPGVAANRAVGAYFDQLEGGDVDLMTYITGPKWRP